MSSSPSTPEIVKPATRAELHQFQSDRLRDMLGVVLARNPFWQKRFAAAGVRGDEIRSPADLARLPFVTKSDLLADQASHPPYGTNLTYEVSAYSRLHQTSGTTGSPMRWLDTPASWQWMLQSWAQLFGLMGLQPHDRLIFPFSFGPFLGFWAGFEGANRLGNMCLAAGGMNSQARLQFLLENQATVLCCTPTYALRLAEVAAESGLHLQESAVRAILVAGEPGGNILATRKQIEQAWGARVFDHWGMTELGPLAIEPESTPGVLTLLETECVVEIVDPQTGQPVKPGDDGELVITNLGRWGSPLIRYRTGDRVRVRLPETPAAVPCPASPPFVQVQGGILSRVDDMLTIRGNNLYPSALEEIIRSFPEVAEFRIEVHVVRSMQHVRLQIEPVATLPVGPSSAALATRIAETIKARWNFQAEVVIVPAGTLPRFEMKAKRFYRVTNE